MTHYQINFSDRLEMVEKIGTQSYIAGVSARAYGIATRSGFVPRRAYAHYFLNSEHIKSRIHLQNFYSIFWPDVEESALATVTILNRLGQPIRKLTRSLPPFGQMYLEMEEFAGIDVNSEGMVFVDLSPGPVIRKKFSKLPEPDKVSIGTPFWMSYRDENENYMYVHSISSLEGLINGSLPPVNWKMSRAKSPRLKWKSWRLLDVQLLDTLHVVAMNHSTYSGKSTVEIFSDNDEVLWSKEIELAPRQVDRVKVPEDLIRFWKEKEVSEHIRIGMSPLFTSNGKPYVVMKYADGPLSLHHG